MKDHKFDIGAMHFAEALDHFDLLPPDWYDQDEDNGRKRHTHLYNPLTGERLHVITGKPQSCVECPFYADCTNPDK